MPYLLGLVCLGGAAVWAMQSGPSPALRSSLDWINMVLLGLHCSSGQVRGLLRNLDEAIAGAWASWCNSPCFGIMGVVSGVRGLVG